MKGRVSSLSCFVSASANQLGLVDQPTNQTVDAQKIKETCFRVVFHDVRAHRKTNQQQDSNKTFGAKVELSPPGWPSDAGPSVGQPGGRIGIELAGP